MEVLAGRFEVHAPVAEGGMGIVHAGLDRDTGKRVAIKRMLRPDDELVRRLQREGQILASLEHPAIVGLIAHGADDAGRPYVVMRWLEGEDLAARLERGPISIDETWELARTMTDALAHLHRRGLVHRDIKPSNVFLLECELHSARLIDFGIARTLADGPRMTQTGVMIGTPGYVAPEQARGETALTPAVDVFSLGCVLFECLAGRPAFVASHYMALLAKVLLEEVADVRVHRPDVPERLALLVMAMTRKDPALRLADGDALARALEEGVSRPSSSRGGRERRVHSVLIARARRASPHASTVAFAHELTRRSAVRDAAASLGVALERLPDGSFLARADGANAADEAVVLARLADRIRTLDFAMAITSGQQVEGSSFGAAIERAFELTKLDEAAIALDETCAAFLESRYGVERGGGRLFLGGERSVSDDARPLLGRATPCVGRERELTILEAAWRDARDAGEPRVVLVTAPAGGGKSRLRHELVRRLGAMSDPCPVYQCRAEALEAAIPYRVASSIVREVAGLGDMAASPREAAFLAELLGVSPEVPVAEVVAARARPDAHFDGVQAAFVSLLARRTAENGAVLVVDDLQWCDPMSSRLLDVLARDVGRPLVIVALARPEVRRVLPQLWTTRDVLDVKLPPLPRRAAERLVRDILPEVDADTLGQIVERSEGNAFFLEELIRASAAQSLEHLPETVLALAQTRLDGMPNEARMLVRYASVFGAPFSAEAIGSLCALEAPALERALDELLGQEALVRQNDGRHAFRHALLQEAAYSTLADEDRVAAHARVARWASAHDEPGEVVAFHHLRAGEVEGAAEALARAAEVYAAQGRLEVAARTLSVSLWLVPFSDDQTTLFVARWVTLADHLRTSRGVLLDELSWSTELPVMPANRTGFVAQLVERAEAFIAGPSQRRALRGAWIEILASCSAYEPARRLLAEAEGEQLSVAERRATLIAACELHHRSGEFRRVREVVAELRPLLADEPKRMLQVLFSAAAAEASLGGASSNEVIRALLDAADEVITRLGQDPSVRVERAKAESLVSVYAGSIEEVVRTCEAHVREARAAGLRFELMIASHNLADALLMRGDHPAAARGLFEESNALAKTFALPRMVAHNEGLLAVIDALLGDPSGLDRAETERQRLLARGDRWDATSVGLHLGRALVGTGRDEFRARVLRETRELAEGLGMLRLIEHCDASLSRG